MYMLKILVYIIWGQIFGLLHTTDQTELSSNRSHSVLRYELVYQIKIFETTETFLMYFFHIQIHNVPDIFSYFAKCYLYTSWKTSVKQTKKSLEKSLRNIQNCLFHKGLVLNCVKCAYTWKFTLCSIQTCMKIAINLSPW